MNKSQAAQEAKIRERLSHLAKITYQHGDETKTGSVQWYGYPKDWNKANLEQKIEWWRQHCVRMFAMPIDAKLVGVEIRFWGSGL